MTKFIFIALACLMIIAAFALQGDAGYVVIRQFQDKYNPSRIYQPGEPVPSWFSQDRINSLVARGLAVSDGQSIPMGFAPPRR